VRLYLDRLVPRLLAWLLLHEEGMTFRGGCASFRDAKKPRRMPGVQSAGIQESAC